MNLAYKACNCVLTFSYNYLQNLAKSAGRIKSQNAITRLVTQVYL